MGRTRKQRLRLLILAAAAFGCSTASLGGTLAIFTAQPIQAERTTA